MNTFDIVTRGLSHPEYLHVLLNPIPVYGLAFGILALLMTLIIRSRHAQIVALFLIVVSCTSAWPVFIFGEKSFKTQYAKSDAAGQAWLDAHMDRAEKFIYAYYFTAVVALLAIFIPAKWPKTGLPLTAFTLILALGLLCLGAYIAYAGGKVTHREFRYEPPPEEETPNQDSNR